MGKTSSAIKRRYNNKVYKSFQVFLKHEDYNKIEKITEKKEIDNLMLNFADTHNLYLYQSLQYRGWQKPEIDAELNWNDISVEEFEALTRAKKLLEGKEDE